MHHETPEDQAILDWYESKSEETLVDLQDRFEAWTPREAWLRFTVNLRHAPIPDVDLLFPPAASEDFDFRSAHELSEQHRRRETLCALFRELPDPDFAASTQALEVANNVREILGNSYTVDPQFKKGHDFYRYRGSILRAGVECGWVG